MSQFIKFECSACGEASAIHPAFLGSPLGEKSLSCPHCKSKSLSRIKGGAGRSESQKRSRKQEKRVAKKFGGSTTPASGAASVKGDIRNAFVSRTECKSTKAKSYSLKLAELQKIASEAEHGEDPIFHIEFAGQHPPQSFVVLPEWVYERLLNADKDDSGT